MKKLIAIFIVLYAVVLVGLQVSFADPPYQKPRLGIQLNRSHPLAKGLINAWLFNEASGGKVFDYAGGNNGTINAGSWVSGVYGIGYSEGSQSNVKPIELDSMIELSSDDSFTFHFLVRTPTIWDNSVNMLIGANDADNYLGRQNAANSEWILQDNGNNNITTDSSIGNQAGLGNTEVGKFRSITSIYYSHSHGIYPDDVELHINGLFVSRGAYAVNPDPRFKIDLLGNAYTNNLYTWGDGRIYLIYIFDRALSIEEIKRLYREPYAMFQRYSKAYRFAAAAAAPAGTVPEIKSKIIISKNNKREGK